MSGTTSNRGRRFVLHFEAGAEVAAFLASGLGAERVPIPTGGTAEAFSSRWDSADAFIFVGALAIALRSAAPLLRDKRHDPAFVAISEDGAVVLPVLSGHIGGASDLARECARILFPFGASFIPTVASDRTGFTAPDLWASRRGYRILLHSGLASVIRKLVDRGEILVWCDPFLEERGIRLPLPAGYVVTTDRNAADLLVSPRSVQKLRGAKPQIVPRVIVAGVGCRRGASEMSIERAMKDGLMSAPGGPFLYESVLELRTASVKSDEKGLLDLADRAGWRVVVLSDEEMRSQVGDFSPSAARRHLNLPGVAEPAASSAGELLGPRFVGDGVTVALSVARPVETGELAVVGTGPGEVRFMTGEAKEAIADADVLIGYNLYVDLLPEPWLRGKIVERYGMGQEEQRVRTAFDYARRGYRVALLSGGDPALFGLACLALSLAPSDVPTRIVAGLSAAQAAGVAVGAPYSNGLVLLSLSDYLQPWDDVVQAMKGARDSGLTVALYNPVRRDLSRKLEEVRRIFAGRRVLAARDAGRDGGTIREIPISELDEDAVDMRTLLLVLSPKANELFAPGGRKMWLEARGYESEVSTSLSPVPLGDFLVLGGTSEGRIVAEKLISAGYRVTLSVARDTGAATAPEGASLLVGPRSKDDWLRIFRDSARSSRLAGVVDASHPFASTATLEMYAACSESGVPLCRYVRPDTIPEGATVVPTPAAAADAAVAATKEGETILLATGVNMLPAMLSRLREAKRKVLARMLPTERSMSDAAEAGLDPREIIAVWGPGGDAFNEVLCVEWGVTCIVSKASGEAGGVAAKAAAAKKLHLPLVLIERPEEPDDMTRIEDVAALLAWCEERVKTGGKGRGTPPGSLS